MLLCSALVNQKVPSSKKLCAVVEEIPRWLPQNCGIDGRRLVPDPWNILFGPPVKWIRSADWCPEGSDAQIGQTAQSRLDAGTVA